MEGTIDMAPTWNPGQYARYADQRDRPFHELLARVGARDPQLVVDLGCGNGPLTLGLAQRWPNARIVGVDSSPDMLAAARELDVAGRVEWLEADLTGWAPDTLGQAPNVVVSNATLQWLPDQPTLLRRWLAALAPDGWLAIQLPGNLTAPSHALMREVADGHARAVELRSAQSRFWVADPAAYLAVLAEASPGQPAAAVDAWETTYLQVLDEPPGGAHPVLEWVRGTGLRPVLDLLTDPDERAAYLEPYAAALEAAYPRTPFGVVYPFRRIFAVAHRHADPAVAS